MDAAPRADIDDCAAKWGVVPEGEFLETCSSVILLGRKDGRPVALKLFKPGSDERGAPAVLRAYAGRGAIEALAWDDGAVLLERVCPGRPLTELTVAGRDDEATRVFCQVADALHRAARPGGGVTPIEALGDSFDRYLASDDRRVDRRRVALAKTLFKRLTASQSRRVLLHGDLHHGNILRDDRRGWLAIDPKGYWGDPAYEAAAFLYNPICHPQRYTDVRCIRRRLDAIAAGLDLDRGRLRQWAYAGMALSLVWELEDDSEPDPNRQAGLEAMRAMLNDV